jgi:hypothetical protein
MAAPTYGETLANLSISGPVTSTPPNAAEAMTGDFDPVFKTVWDATKSLFPGNWQGDWAKITAIADVAYRYKTGGVANVTLASISPTTGVHAAAFTVTCTGTNYDPSATIVFAGTDLSTNNLSGTSMTASVPAALTPTATTYSVTVRGANGVVTAAQTFTAT